AFRWIATLTVPGGVNLGGRTLQESDGGNASDSCHYAGSPIDEFTAIPTRQIQISSNDYQDTVGWSEAAVACYRGSGTGCTAVRVACNFFGTQVMSINVPGADYYQYKTNVVQGSINAGTVYSARDNYSISRTW